MGIPYSCPSFDDLDNKFDAALMRSISFHNDDVHGGYRSVSFNGRDSEPSITSSFGSGRMLLEGSLSLKGREMETMFTIKSSSGREKMFVRSNSFKKIDIEDQLPMLDSSYEDKPSSPLPARRSHRNQAALRLQKVYKSFRTRRQLADCAVIVEQKWWKLLDFAELKRSSISFFDIERPETAISRWSRARTRAAKVGKGLSKDEKARKLALQHWLEAIDPRHRYGHNLQFYYVRWLHCESKEPFFYWLDIGEGREVNLADRCPRSKLQQQCIKYLGPTEREAYEVAVEDGKFYYKQTGKVLDTREGPKDVKWIFVLSTSKTFYVGQKNKGVFQHSSFLAGGATLAAGRLVVEDGTLKAVWPHSGHYLPTEENFQELMTFLEEQCVDLTIVKKNPTDEEEELTSKKEKGSSLARTRSSRNAEVQKPKDSNEEADTENDSNLQDISRLSQELCSKLAKLEIPNRTDVAETAEEEHLPGPCCDASFEEESTTDGYETAEESFLTEEDFIFSKVNLFGEDSLEEDDEPPISREIILRRIYSHRRTKSYQLAQRLSCKWTTGAGPRIGCVRDYPSRLQSRVLEQVNLSPRVVRSTALTIGFGSAGHSPRSPYEEKITGKSSLSQVQGPLSETETSPDANSG